jgi:hypothetical protein
MKRIAGMAMAAVCAVTATPVFAANQSRSATEPVKLTDGELEEVSAGAGSLLDLKANLNILLQNIAVTVNVSNVPINLGIAVQANALGQAIQNATVMAGQQVTQAQSLPTFH